MQKPYLTSILYYGDSSVSQKKRGQMNLNNYVAITFDSSAPPTPDILLTHSKHTHTHTNLFELLTAAKSLQSCQTLCDPIDGGPLGSPVPGILQARTLGCHFLLQCMKVKSESEVAQSCPTLSDPMDCGLPGFSVYGILQARVLLNHKIKY